MRSLPPTVALALALSLGAPAHAKTVCLTHAASGLGFKLVLRPACKPRKPGKPIRVSSVHGLARDPQANETFRFFGTCTGEDGQVVLIASDGQTVLSAFGPTLETATATYLNQQGPFVGVPCKQLGF
jgi:hypothetical protein